MLKMKGLTILLLVTTVSFFLQGCEKKLEMYTETAYMLGTQLQISVWTDNRQQAQKAVEKSFNRIKEIENRMSVNIEESDISLINKNSGIKAVKVHDDTAVVIKKSLEYAAMSKGAFDPTIGSLVKLWGIGTEHQRIPNEDEIKSILNLVDYNSLINTEKNEFMLHKKRSSMDLGGIAKGYAADEVYSILKSNGIEHAIINLGGNVLTLGTKVNGDKWRVGIQNPYEPIGTHLGIIEVSDETVVSSGNYERYFIKDNIRYHHIIDPKTGFPANNGIISSTIITSKSIDADALSTSVYVLGVEEGLKLIESLDNVDTIIVTEKDEVYISSGLKDRLTIIDEKFSLAN